MGSARRDHAPPSRCPQQQDLGRPHCRENRRTVVFGRCGKPAGEAGLHVNDNKVDQGGTPLRNGDIVWLGTPGDVDVVMLQCILPRVAAQPAPPPPRPAPEAPPEPAAVMDENETVSLGPETFFEADGALTRGGKEFAAGKDDGSQGGLVDDDRQ